MGICIGHIVVHSMYLFTWKQPTPPQLLWPSTHQCTNCGWPFWDETKSLNLNQTKPWGGCFFSFFPLTHPSFRFQKISLIFSPPLFFPPLVFSLFFSFTIIFFFPMIIVTSSSSFFPFFVLLLILFLLLLFCCYYRFLFLSFFSFIFFTILLFFSDLLLFSFSIFVTTSSSSSCSLYVFFFIFQTFSFFCITSLHLLPLLVASSLSHACHTTYAFAFFLVCFVLFCFGLWNKSKRKMKK